MEVGIWRIGASVCIGVHRTTELLDPQAEPNVKTIALGLGHVFLFAVLRNGGVFDFEFQAGNSFQLWPQLHPTMLWPPLFSISSDDAEGIAMAAYKAVGAPEVLKVTQ